MLLMCSDGIHPNAYGHELIADSIVGNINGNGSYGMNSSLVCGWV